MKYYITDDTSLAAYLYLLGYEFKEGTIWSSETYRKKYVLIDDAERLRHEEDFYMRKTSVAPLDFEDARVRVSRFLKREIRDPRKPTL